MRSIGILALIALAGCKGDPDDEISDCIQIVGDETPYASLAEAVSAAPAGATIAVCNGWTLLEDTVSISRNLTLSGNGMGRSIVRPPLGAPTLVVEPGVTLTVQGITLQGTQTVIELEDAGLIATDVHFEAPGAHAVRATNSTIEATGLQVTSAGEGGLRVYGGSLTVSDSLFSNVTGFGIELGQGATGTIERNQFLNGRYTVDAAGQVNLDGFGVHGGSNAVLVLADNVFTNNTLGGVHIEGASLTMNGDTLTGNWAGLWVERGQLVRLTDLTVDDSFVYGMVLISAFDVTFDNVSVRMDPSSSATDDPTTVDTNEGSFGVRAIDANVVWTGGTVSGANSGGVLVGANLTTGVRWDLKDVVFDNNGQLGLGVLLGTVTAENVDILNTRDDEACLVDGFLNCNFGVLFSSVNATFTGGLLQGNQTHGHLLFDTSLQWTGGEVRDQGEYGVYLIDSSLSTNGTLFDAAGSAGIYASGGTTTLTNTTFRNGKHAVRYDLGGGLELEVDGQGVDVLSDYDTTITVIDSVFEDGDRAIDAFFATLDVRNTTFSGYSGGAVSNYLGPTTLRDIEIADSGGYTVSCTSGDLSLREVSIRNSGESATGQRQVSADGTVTNEQIITSRGPLISASSCPFVLEDVLIEGAAAGAVELRTSDGEIDGLIVRDVDGGAHIAAVAVSWGAAPARFVANDIRLENVRMPGFSLTAPTGDNRGDDDLEITRLRLGAADAPVAGVALRVEGVQNVEVQGMAAFSADAAALSVANARLNVVGTGSGVNGTLEGAVGARVTGDAARLALSNTVVRGLSGSGLELYGGEHAITTVEVHGDAGYGLRCLEAAPDAEPDPEAPVTTFSACADLTAEGSDGQHLGCEACFSLID